MTTWVKVFWSVCFLKVIECFLFECVPIEGKDWNSSLLLSFFIDAEQKTGFVSKLYHLNCYAWFHLVT